MRKNNKYLNCHTEEGRSPDVSISAIFFILLFPFSTHATCTPAPDCASIGYTQTSCETKFVKCPFDTSKLFCIPCDSSFKYDCNNHNILGGIGNTCNNKFASCQCYRGKFNNGLCPQICTVGMIYYSDDTCSFELDSSKTAIGIVVKDNELVMSRQTEKIAWGTGVNITNLPDLSYEQAEEDFSGKNNTAIIVEFHKTVGLTSANSAAIYCNSLSTTGTNAGDWYLPALGELYNYIYGNYETLNTTGWATLDWKLIDRDLWSSSEYSDVGAFHSFVNVGQIWDYSKGEARQVTCFLAIN